MEKKRSSCLHVTPEKFLFLASVFILFFFCSSYLAEKLNFKSVKESISYFDYFSLEGITIFQILHAVTIVFISAFKIYPGCISIQIYFFIGLIIYFQHSKVQILLGVSFFLLKVLVDWERICIFTQS